MTIFVPNPKAVQSKVDELLARKHDGSIPSLDEACYIAYNSIHAETNENTSLFWRAVYNKLHAKRTGCSPIGDLSQNGNK